MQTRPKSARECNQNAINRSNSWVAREVKGSEAGSSLHRGLVSGLWDVLEHTNIHKHKFKTKVTQRASLTRFWCACNSFRFGLL